MQQAHVAIGLSQAKSRPVSFLETEMEGTYVLQLYKVLFEYHKLVKWWNPSFQYVCSLYSNLILFLVLFQL